MTEKIIGYTLLFLGIGLIVYSGFNVYQVFTRRAEPVNLFQFKGVNLDLSGFAPSDLPKGKTELKQELISSDLLNQTSNIAAHIFLMGFVVSIGFKIASLGVMLVRPIVVKLKEKTVSESVPKQA